MNCQINFSKKSMVICFNKDGLNTQLPLVTCTAQFLFLLMIALVWKYLIYLSPRWIHWNHKISSCLSTSSYCFKRDFILLKKSWRRIPIKFPSYISQFVEKSVISRKNILKHFLVPFSKVRSKYINSCTYFVAVRKIYDKIVK